MTLPEHVEITERSRDGLQLLGVFLPTEVGSTSVFDVGANPCTAYVPTPPAMIALDSSTGEVKWWQHLPFE